MNYRLTSIPMKTELAGLIALVAAASGCTVTGSFTEAPLNETGTVIDATDGDTLQISINDSIEDVRLIGIDAPETYGEVDPEEFDMEDTEENRKCLSIYADVAKREAEKIEASQVRVYQDPVQNLTGTYGRKLAYIYTGDGYSFNRRMLERGYARVYVSKFVEAENYLEVQREAREAGRGLWSCH